MVVLALLRPFVPHIIGAAVLLGGILYVHNLQATVVEQREAIGAEKAAAVAARAQSDALAHELDVAQSALVARDVQLAAVREDLASRSATLRRIVRRPDVETWARTAVPGPVAGLLRLDNDDAGRNDAAGDSAGGAVE